jgi:hypothetical protein
VSSTENARAIPIRAIVMILISLAILFAALGVHGFVTRDDDPQAALNAQEAKLSAAATETAAAPDAAKPTVCLIAVNRAPLADTTDKLTKAGMAPLAETEVWPARPAAPRATTVYFGDGGEGQAKTVAAALANAPTAARPDGLEACAGSIAVAVVRK